MSEFNKDIFSFKELISNSNGKNSGSGFIGLFMGITSILSFISGVICLYIGIEYSIDLLEKSIQLGTLSALLMGVRKAASLFGGKSTN